MLGIFPLSQSKLKSILFVIIVFVTTRQFPFSFLSPLMNVALLALVIVTLFQKKITKDEYRLFTILLLPLVFSLFYSILITDNTLGIILRFFLILVFVGVAYFVSVNENGLKWFISLCVLQSIVMLCIFLYIIAFLGQAHYIPLRLFFLDMGWGDIYTYNGYFYRIQIKGSALLLIALILNIESDLFKKKYLISILLIIGIILAGNFAFVIAGAIYFFYTILRLKYSLSSNRYLFKVCFVLMIILAASPQIYSYLKATIEVKQEGSLGARSDQIEYLTNDLNETPFSLLLGQGLGNTLKIKSESRDYEGKTYYELQAYYIFNQLGIIFFSLYILYHMLIVLKKWGKNKEIIFFYFIYISYAITNPYIIDTTQFIIIVVLNSWVMLKNEKTCKIQYQQ